MMDFSVYRNPIRGTKEDTGLNIARRGLSTTLTPAGLSLEKSERNSRLHCQLSFSNLTTLDLSLSRAFRCISSINGKLSPPKEHLIQLI